MIEFRKNKQQHRTEAVERQAGAEQEAGVQPFALRVRAGEEAAEKQFQHPAADAAEEKQIQNDQKHLKFGHSDLRILFPQLTTFLFRCQAKRKQ